MEFLLHLGKTSLYLLVFYGCYWLLLRRYTFFHLNRAYLLLALLLSLVLPWLQLSATLPVADVLLPVGMPKLAVPENVAAVAVTENYGVSWISLGLWIYFTGVLIALIRFGRKLFAVVSFLRHEDAVDMPGMRVIISSNASSGSFSFFRWVVVSRQDYESCFDTILHHESVHVRQRHSLDILWVELMGVLCWFHPVIPFYRKSLHLVHEYLADRENPEKDTYARFLLEYAFNAPVSGLGNHFYYPSFLWQRIGMLYQGKNAPWALGRYGVAALITGMVTFMVVSCERIGDSKVVSRSEVERLVRGTVVDEEGERLPGAVITVVGSPDGTATDAQGSFSITVPEGGRLYAGFIGYAGQETNPLSEGVNEVHFRLKPEPRAGLLKKKSVSSGPLSSGSSAAVALEGSPGEKKIYTVVEKQPEFPGGREALSAYLGRNLKYPETARMAGIEGKVYLQFVVTDAGQMTDVMILQGIGHGCDEEAVRIVKSMPRWKPGSQDGKALNVRYVLPVRFELKK